MRGSKIKSSRRRVLQAAGALIAGAAASQPRSAHAQSDAELVRLQPDVIVANGALPARALSNATQTIPIVFASHADPVGMKLVESFAHPGGNVTGVSEMAPELAGVGDEPGQVAGQRLGIPGLEHQAVLAVSQKLLVDGKRRGDRNHPGGPQGGLRLRSQWSLPPGAAPARCGLRVRSLRPLQPGFMRHGTGGPGRGGRGTGSTERGGPGRPSRSPVRPPPGRAAERPGPPGEPLGQRTPGEARGRAP